VRSSEKTELSSSTVGMLF